MSKQVEPNKTLYIANFPKDTQKSELEELLSAYGKIVNICIVNKEKFSFAFADFETIEDAKRVQEKLDQKTFKDMNMKVNFKDKRENTHSNFLKPTEHSSPNPYHSSFKGTTYEPKSSLGETYTIRRNEYKVKKRSASSSSRERKISMEKGNPKDRSRNKEYKRKDSSEESSGRYQHKNKSKNILHRPIEKPYNRDLNYEKPHLTQFRERPDSNRDKTSNLEKEVTELSREIQQLTKKLNRFEGQFEEFIDEFKSKEHKRR